MRNLTSFTLAVTMFAAGLVLTITPAHAQTPVMGLRNEERRISRGPGSRAETR